MNSQLDETRKAVVNYAQKVLRLIGTSPSLPTAIAAATVALISIAALFLTHHAGWTLYYGDAEAHLNHARRIWDSRTPGWEQLGTVWLPLPHLLMLPFVANRSLWQTGMAGAIPASICFVAASTFLFAGARLLLNSVVLATTATALFVLNPNILYLQAVPMTESVFFLAVLGILYFLASFQKNQSIASVFGVAFMVLAGTLTRYEGWLLIPLAGLILLVKASRKRAEIVTLFVSVAAIGPIAWMAYNWWITGNALDFYNGPYSPRAIQGVAPYPGEGDWYLASVYVLASGKASCGSLLCGLGFAGLAGLIYKRLAWPVILLATPPLLIVASLHSGGTPIQIPGLPFPHSWYNTRYGLSFLPLLSFSSVGTAMLVPSRREASGLCLAALTVLTYWVSNPHPEDWIVWKESQVNSEARRAWTREAAAYLATRVRGTDCIFTGSGDVNGVFREAGIPLRQTLTVDNGLMWDAARTRPDLFLSCQWAVALMTPGGRSDGDRVGRALDQTRPRGPKYELVKRINSQDGKVLDVFRRSSATYR